MSTATENQQPASSSSPLRRFVARCPVAAFLVMLYTVTWIIFLPVVLQGRGLLALPIDLSEGRRGRAGQGKEPLMSAASTANWIRAVCWPCPSTAC